MYKKMLGDTIYRLRKEKGLSQAELGEFVGVSNKAVSKWETYEANPDITLLPLLAQALGVTTDELLTDIKAEKDDPKPKETKIFGVQGTVIETPEEYEFVSDKKTKKDLPYLHIHIGKQIQTINAKARGVVAIGNNAKGVIGIGLFSVGIISLGIVPLGLLAIGTFGLGLIAIGSIVLGVISVGAVAAGLVSIGSVSIGFLSYGPASIGYYAHTIKNGYVLGKYTFIH
jgi:transcriptional regulator with XRE-family HTH domain